jgi:hypothetical protein
MTSHGNSSQVEVNLKSTSSEVEVAFKSLLLSSFFIVLKGFQGPRRPVESPLAIADIGLDLQGGGAYGHG